MSFRKASPRTPGLPGFVWRLVALAGALLIRALGTTWRVSVEGDNPFASGGPGIGAIWHRGFLVAAYGWRDRSFAIPVSRSRDGERIDAVLRQLGFAESPRGSSSAGATALLRELIRCVRRGQPVGILPDGPRGPAGRAKPGVVALARATGVPIVPLGISARPCIQLGSWDRAIVPLPFARVICRFGAPHEVPKRTPSGELEKHRLELERTLHRLDDELDARLGRTPAPAKEPGQPA